MKEVIIRKIKVEEICLLENFIYEAIFQRDEKNLLPRNIIKNPEIAVYINDFGNKDDNCLVAECDGKIVGAVWTRILCGEIKGYGNIDNSTPEFAISLYKEYRNKGIGTKLMMEMLNLLKNNNYKQTSLAVQKDNYAYKLYKSLGFEIVDENDEEYLMLCKLT